MCGTFVSHIFYYNALVDLADSADLYHRNGRNPFYLREIVLKNVRNKSAQSAKSERGFSQKKICENP